MNAYFFPWFLLTPSLRFYDERFMVEMKRKVHFLYGFDFQGHLMKKAMLFMKGLRNPIS
jgi:hypothetical protein